MSKSNAISDPMSFLYLDLMATILLRDTQELETEFNTKMEFIREQEQSCLSNERNLLLIDESVDTLKSSVLNLELELQENECSILEVERIITRIEDNRMPNACQHDNLIKRSSYLELLKLLISADRSAEKCNNLKEEVEQYNKEVDKRAAPGNVICRIMDYHNEALAKMEQQIDELQCKANYIVGEFEEINDSMSESTLNNENCNCKSKQTEQGPNMCEL